MRMPLELGEVTLADRGMALSVKKGEPPTKVHNLSTANTINLNEVSVIINNTFYFRTRQEGDTLLMRGMHRKLRKLYNAAKISPSVRERLPLLCDEEGIVWAPFVGTRDDLPTEGEAIRIRIVSTKGSF